MPDIRLSCVVMAHPSRAKAAHALAASLPELAPRVVFDPEPDGPPATLRTARAAWSAVPPGSTHHLVLQDDATPVPGMAATLEKVLTAHPELPVSLFCEWGSATASMARWAALGGFGLAECVDSYVPTVGLALPSATAVALVEAVDRHHPGDPDDEVIARFLEEGGRSAFVTVPNLVQHDGDGSLVGNDHAMGARRSALLARPGEEVGEEVLAAPALVPCVSWRRARAAMVRWDTGARRHDGHVSMVRAELERAGTAHSELVSGLDRWLEGEEGHALEGALGYGLVHELWTVAVALAVFSPLIGREGVPPLAVTRALTTLGPGGLRTVAPAAAQEPLLADALVSLAVAGLAFGSEVAVTPSGPPTGVGTPLHP